MRNNKKRIMTAGLLVLALVVGTLAFFFKEMSIDNPFATKAYGGETVEKFTPPTDWQPGGEITKEVQAKNTGDYPLYARVMFSEKWERDGKTIEGTALDSTNAALFFPASADKSVTGGSSVYKNLVGVTDKSWTDGKDGYFYYATTLEAGEMTSPILESVTLCKDADMGDYIASSMKYALVADTVDAASLTDDDYTYDKAPETVPEGYVLYQKKEITLDPAKSGLANANYTLTITTQFVQANADAAKEQSWTVIPTA